jgi:hypothetical protein
MQKSKLTLNSILLILIAVIGVSILLKNQDNETDLLHTGMIHSKTVGEVAVMPGQEAFGTIQEIIGILENDPETDWKTIDIDALLVHLIDMNELTMYSNVDRENVPGGLKMVVTGTGRTVDAIKRMVPTHNSMTLSSVDVWETTVENIDNGVVLTVTSDDNLEIDKIRGLGFIGIMAIGSQHPIHHLMMAKGSMHMISNH